MTRAALAIAAAAIVLASCGAQRAPLPAASAPAPAADPRAQIVQLDNDITVRWTNATLEVPTAADIDAARTETMDAAAKVCAPPQPPPAACTDACTLGDAICDDANHICVLADQLAGDAWAADRCARGKASCERARQRCCACR